MIETNFSRIDEMVQDMQKSKDVLDIDFKVIFPICHIFQQEIYKLMNIDGLVRNPEISPILSFKNVVMNIDRKERGFIQASFETVYDNMVATVSHLEKNCTLTDDNITDLPLYAVNYENDIEEDYYNSIEKEIETIKNNKEKTKKNFLEKDLEKLLIEDLSIIEEGMTLIKNQYAVSDGYIDILARDKNNKLCIIELKKVKNDSKIIQQCVYYPTQFDEKVRMITIAPDYSNKVSKSLKALKYVEMKTYNLNEGLLETHDY